MATAKSCMIRIGVLILLTCVAWNPVPARAGGTTFPFGYQTYLDGMGSALTQVYQSAPGGDGDSHMYVTVDESGNFAGLFYPNDYMGYVNPATGDFLYCGNFVPKGQENYIASGGGPSADILDGFPNGNVDALADPSYYDTGEKLKLGGILYYKSGNVMRSGNNWYYDVSGQQVFVYNGGAKCFCYLNQSRFNNGNNFYYPNGSVLRDSSGVINFSNGNVFRNGSNLNFVDGSVLRLGAGEYHYPSQAVVGSYNLTTGFADLFYSTAYSHAGLKHDVSAGIGQIFSSNGTLYRDSTDSTPGYINYAEPLPNVNGASEGSILIFAQTGRDVHSYTLYDSVATHLVYQSRVASSAPTAATGSASGIGSRTATVSGSLTVGTGGNSVSFEYGTSAAYGTTVVGMISQNSVSATLVGLLPHTQYHYRLDAANNFGASAGADATFTTANTPPGAGTSVASVNLGATASINLPFATTDADGDSVTVQSIGASVGAPFTLGTVTGNAVPLTASLNAAGTGTINFTVSDGFGGTANGSVTVTVIDNVPPVFTSVPSEITVEAPRGATGAVVNYAAATASDNIGVALLTVNYPSGSTFPIGQTMVQYTAADAAGNTTQASFNVNVLPGAAEANPVGVKGTAVVGGGFPPGTMWSSFGVPCATSSGDAFFIATLFAGKISQKDVVLLDGMTGNVNALIQAGTAVSGVSGATFSSFKDPLAVSTAGGEDTVTYLATIAGKGITSSKNQVLIRNRVSAGAMTGTDLLCQAGVTVDQSGAKVSRITTLGLGPDGTVWASARLLPGFGHVTTSNNTVVLSWTPGSTVPVEVLRKGMSLTLSDGKKHVVNTIATLAAASASPGQGRWEGSNGLIARVGFSDGASAVLTTTGVGALIEGARNGGSITLLDSAGAVEATGVQWSSFGLPSLDLGNGTAFKAALAANIGGVSSKNASGIFRQEYGSSEWTALVRMPDSTGLTDRSVFSGFSDPVSNGAGTVAFVATQLAGNAKTAGLWTSSFTGTGPSVSRVLKQVAAAHQIAPDTGGALFASFVSAALPEWENAGPLFVATLQNGPDGGKVTVASKTGLWGVDYNGNLRLLLRTGSPLPGAVAGNPVVKAFSVLQAVSGSTGQPRAIDGLYEVFCNVTFSNGATAVVKIQVP